MISHGVTKCNRPNLLSDARVWAITFFDKKRTMHLFLAMVEFALLKLKTKVFTNITSIITLCMS
jgi:hypothetical protein